MATKEGKPTWGRFFRGCLVAVGYGAGVAGLDYVGTNLPPLIDQAVGVGIGGLSLMLINFVRDKILKK